MRMMITFFYNEAAYYYIHKLSLKSSLYLVPAGPFPNPLRLLCFGKFLCLLYDDLRALLHRQLSDF